MIIKLNVIWGNILSMFKRISYFIHLFFDTVYFLISQLFQTDSISTHQTTPIF